MNTNTNTNTNTQKRYNVKPTRDYRANATDARYKVRLIDTDAPAIACKLQQTGNVTRYIALDSWLETVKPADVASVIVGKMNKNALYYQCIIDTDATPEMHANMIAANGNAPLWYATETGYCSPNFANAKWHDKLESVFAMMNSGTVRIIITDAFTGATFDVVTFSGDRNALGRFIKKDETRKSPLLQAIDKATIARKGYSNYPQKKRFAK